MDDLHAPMVTSGPTSQATSRSSEKEESLQELMARKENLEAELSALSSVLDLHGVNMSTPLLTPDGFPRADIDVAQIRTTRASIVRMKNDHKALMAKLEVVVHKHFAEGKAPEAAAATPSSRAPAVQTGANGDAVQADQPRSAIEPPFARVNTVVPNSPAEQAGMQAGDKVTKFSSVNWTNHERLSKVAQVVQQNENRSILVKVLRDTSPAVASTTISLQLTPRRDWGGRGLLGCHLLPL